MTMTQLRPGIAATTVSTLAAILVVLSATPALAHVHIDIDETRPGARARYTVSVPNESDSADTIQVEVQLPEGLEVQRHRPPEGWEMADDQGVLTISGGALPPGATAEFRFVATNPPRRGEEAFPSIQTYSDGEEVRWIGEPDSDHPAPVVRYSGSPVEQPTQPEHNATEIGPPPSASPSPSLSPEPTDEPTASPTAEPTATEPPAATDDGGLPVPVLIIIGLGLAAAAALGALAMRSRA